MLVGRAAKKYCLHKTLLCHHSTFFDAAFNGEFKEGKSGELRLPEETPDSFDLFVHWLYRGSFFGLNDPERRYNYLSVYTMGVKWFIPELQDKVCDEMRTFWYMYGIPDSFFFQELYKNTSPGCKLRQYFVKKFISYAIYEDHPANVNDILELNEELAVDVAKETFKNLSMTAKLESDLPRVELLSRCSFHIHGSDAGCHLAGI